MTHALTSIANRRLRLAWAFLFASLGAAGAQAYTPPPPPLQFGPCVPTKEFPCDPPQKALTKAAAAASAKAGATPAANGAKPSPAQQFAFPGEPTDAPTPATPTAGQMPTDSSRFPFPGEPAADDAGHAAGEAPAAPAGSSSSSSSDSPGASPASDPDSAGLKDAGSTGSTRFERRKLAVPVDLNKRESDDLDVSHFYITTGNYAGAYARAQDAVQLYPDDEQAHYALGLAAEKMKKRDEAIQEYKLYLKLAPDGPKARQVEKALDELGAK